MCLWLRVEDLFFIYFLFSISSALWISICVFGVEGLGFRVWGSGFGVRVLDPTGLGFRV